MPPNDPLYLYLKLQVSHDDTQLLEGLDTLLKLELITDQNVQDIGKKYLSCPLPVTKKQPSQKAFTSSAVTSQNNRPRLALWQNLRAELSVRWLLLSGIFLVLASSGVLAAGAWQKFSVIGQYSVLAAYTIAFWSIGNWIYRKSSIPLTAQSLQTIGILLIPLNFLAMDTLNLWSSLTGIILVTFSSTIFTGICLWQNRGGKSLSSAYNFLALSYFHWGWGWETFPLIAIYVGGAITFVVLRFLSPKRQVGIRYILYAFLIILLRAIFIQNIPLEQVGLVLGVEGWLVSNRRIKRKIKFFAPLLGFSLMAIAINATIVAELPWQAILILSLGIQRCFDYLKVYWQKRYLLAIMGLGLLQFFLLPKLLPLVWRENLVTWWIGLTATQTFRLGNQTITILFYLWIVMGLIDWLYRRRKDKIALLGERISLGIGLSATIVSLLHPVTRFLHLTIASVTLIVWSYWRRDRKPTRIYMAQIVAIITLVATIDWQFPHWQPWQWGSLLTIVGGLELWASSGSRRLSEPDSWLAQWGQSGWWLGLILSLLSFLVFVDINSTKWAAVWAIIPVTLSFTAPSYSGKQQQVFTYSTIALVGMQFLTLGDFAPRNFSLALAIVLMWFNNRYRLNLNLAILHWGFILGLPVGLLSKTLSFADWWLGFVLVGIIAWGIARFIREKYPIYAQAAHFWSIAIGGIELILLSLRAITGQITTISPSWQSLGAILLITVCLSYQIRRESRQYLIYLNTWVQELAIVEIITWVGGGRLAIAAVNIGLGLLSLKLNRGNPVFFPLFYGAIALGCRWGYVNSYTGLIMVGVGAIVAGASRHLPSLTYTAAILITIGLSETVWYSTASFAIATQISILALVLGIVAIAAQSWAWLSERRNQEMPRLKLIGQGHWLLASIFDLSIVFLEEDTPTDLIFWLILVALLLASYAFSQGRYTSSGKKNFWVYLGIGEIILTSIYIRLIWAQLQVLDTWLVILSVIIAWLIYQLPWRNWGWQSTPWHRSGAILPCVGIISGNPGDIGIIAVALFYLYLALQQQNIRWVYLSLGFFDWAMARWLWHQDYLNLLWLAIIVGSSCLCIAEVDPWLKSQRQKRHYFRVFGYGIIAAVALFSYQETGIMPIIIGLVGIFWGLMAKIRAFLFVGTIAFMATVFYQLVVLSFAYALLKWILGLLMGIILIALAASFERRREQITRVWQNWLRQLSQWA